VAIIDTLNGSIYFKNEIYPIDVTEPGFKIVDYMGIKILVYVVRKGNYLIRISTLLEPQIEKVELTKTLSFIFAIVVYFVVVISGYMFIRSMSNRIEEYIRRLRLFNSNISHELRTPLTVIRGETELAIQSPPSPERCVQLMREIREEIDHISEITERLLFITKQENIDPRSFEQVDLEELILEIFEKYSSRINIELDIGEDEVYLITGDKALIKIALTNLIENSIKYKATKLTISLRRVGDKIELKLKDNGQGIPPEKLPYIFDAFYRVDDSRNRKVKGFGLGLFIVKSILQLHKTEVDIHSDGVGKGVTFTIKFPIKFEEESNLKSKLLNLFPFLKKKG
jgi:signal transduction histidine kinase